MGENPSLPPLNPRPGSGGGSLAFSRYQNSPFAGAGVNQGLGLGETFSIVGQELFSAPELPDIVGKDHYSLTSNFL